MLLMQFIEMKKCLAKLLRDETANISVGRKTSEYIFNKRNERNI